MTTRALLLCLGLLLVGGCFPTAREAGRAGSGPLVAAARPDVPSLRPPTQFLVLGVQ